VGYLWYEGSVWGCSEVVGGGVGGGV